MIKQSILVSLAFACLPMFANANVITLEYTGHVTTVFGAGYGNAIGDTVSGKVEVDLSKATTKSLDTPTAVSYFSPSFDGLVTNNGSLGDPAGVDFVDIYNGSHLNWLGESEDFFQVMDATATTPEFSDYLQITLTLKGFDWLTDLSLSDVNIITSDIPTLGWSFGSVSRTVGTLEADGNYSWAFNSDIFSLDSLKLVSTEVPEPSSIVLIGLGSLALFVRRRRLHL